MRRSGAGTWATMAADLPAAATGGAPGEQARCRVCGQWAAMEPFSVREMMFGSGQSFDYVRCAACGSLLIRAVPNDLDRFYPAGYYSLAGAGTLARQDARRRWATGVFVDKKIFHRKSRLAPLATAILKAPPAMDDLSRLVAAAHLRSRSDPILDVGSGAHPDRMVVLRQFGFTNLTAIDPYVAGRSRHHGVPVLNGTIEQMTGRYRFITFHHSLEHVAEPEATLRAARRLIDARGRIQVRTPVMGTGLWRRYGTDWVELDAPRHLAVFSLKGFQCLVASTGFEIERIGWESTAWEFAASEQYRRGIPLHGPDSQVDDPSLAGVDAATLEEFRAEARRLNAAGDGGRASFWLRPVEIRDAAGSQPQA